MYQIIIDNRDYSHWTFNSNEKILENINPLNNHLFSGDSFTIDTDQKVVIEKSPIRSTDSIPAVLILKGNKTYGRNNGPKGKLLYKCIPDDISIPSFLVPYEIKNIGFSKVFVNIYITIQFKEWQEKHPIGIVKQVIGPVDDLISFYEYQIHCKELNISLQKFNKDTSKALEKYSHQGFIERMLKKYPTVLDRTEWYIFTIDPEKSKDFDDGFSIKELYNDKTLISVYISNVVLWMEELNLWDSFSDRVSTIYLPDQKKTMMPMILSDSICSLTEKTNRLAFTMDITIDNLTGEIVEVKYVNTIVNVSKNFVYEEPTLIKNGDYIWLKEKVLSLHKNYKYLPSINDSHEVVAYLMTMMNHYCSVALLKKKTGIFRTFSIKDSISPINSVPNDISTFIKIWSSHSSGCYQLFQEDGQFAHEMIDLNSYVHITSPIRRLVDLLNMIQMMNNEFLKLSEKAIEFYERWIERIDYINISMKKIRRVQTDCQLLSLCSTDPNVLTKEFTIYLIEEREKHMLYEYTVYIPEIKMVTYLKTQEKKTIFKEEKGKLYLFEDEAKMKKKIRLQLIS